MTTTARVLLVIIVGGALLTVATVATAAVAIYSGGTIAVSVEDQRQGDRFSVRVPAGIANMAINLVPGTVVDEALRDVSREMEPLLPSVRNAWSELNATGDFVLVEVNDGDEHVLVRKIGNRLLVTVDTDETDIEIALPMKTLGKLVHKL